MKWIARAFRNGALLGLGLLVLLSIPLGVTCFRTFQQERRLQSSLLLSAGETKTEVRTAPLTLTGLVNGVPREDVSGSLDQGNWFMPDNGIIRLQGKPGLNTVSLSYENRVVSTQIELTEKQETTLALDAGLAPNIPDLMIMEPESSADFVFSFPVQNADRIMLENAPDGVTQQQKKGQFEISIPSKHLQKSFISFSVQSANQYGTSRTYVGIISPDPGPLIEIRTPDDLSLIRKNLSGNYQLMNDLDLSDIDSWLPIGTSDFPFSGVFNGNNFEISGFHLIDSAYDRGPFALFENCKNAIIRNTIIREPDIEIQNQENANECFSALANTVHQSLLENNAVVGGKVNAEHGGASGLFCSSENSILRALFNSADVFSGYKERVMRNTGGIVGGGSGYLTRCANEGTISGRHLTGGIVGYAGNFQISHCISSGPIYGQPLVGEFPPGAIIQTADAGMIRNSLFLRGSAERGGTLFGEGVFNGIQIIEPDQLQNPTALVLLGSFAGKFAQWEFSEKNARGPVPKGIFRRPDKNDE